MIPKCWNKELLVQVWCPFEGKAKLIGVDLLDLHAYHSNSRLGAGTLTSLPQTGWELLRCLAPTRVAGYNRCLHFTTHHPLRRGRAELLAT